MPMTRLKNRRTLPLMRRRKLWRKRALQSTHQLVTWQTGKPGREACEVEVLKSLAKLEAWFGRRASLVSQSIQRRAMRTFNTPPCSKT